jgi:hypothetical protein
MIRRSCKTTFRINFLATGSGFDTTLVSDVKALALSASISVVVTYGVIYDRFVHMFGLWKESMQINWGIEIVK